MAKLVLTNAVVKINSVDYSSNINQVEIALLVLIAKSVAVKDLPPLAVRKRMVVDLAPPFFAPLVTLPHFRVAPGLVIPDRGLSVGIAAMMAFSGSLPISLTSRMNRVLRSGSISFKLR